MKRISTYLRFVLIAMVLIVPVSMLSAQTSWEQIGSTTYGDAVNNASGKSVAINANGSIVAIGAPENDNGGANIGQVKVLEYVSGVWQQKGAALYGVRAGDEFGRFVSLSADGLIVAIGGSKYDGLLNDKTDIGLVRVFKFESGAWGQIGQDIEGEAAGDLSGTSVSLSEDGTILAIGSPENDGGGSNSGHTRVFKYDGATWNLRGAEINGEAVDDLSGYSVSLSADGFFVAIGAYLNNSGAGHTRVYEYNGTAWNQLGADIDGEAGDASGASVSLNDDGSIVAIGAYKHSGRRGGTRIYKNISGTWTPIGGVIVGTATTDDSGKNISLNSTGSIVVIGAAGNTSSVTGKTKIFYNNAGTWIQLGQDILGDAAADYCGYGVAIADNGSKVIVGYYGADNGLVSNAGAIKVFDLKATETWTGTATASNDWLVPGNWSLGIVPTNNISATIPAGLVNYPILATAAICDDLTIESTETSTGSILGQSNLTVNGATTVKRQMSENAWHLVASTAPGEDIQSFLAANSNIPSKDISGTESWGMMDYNESANNWNNYFTGATAGSLDAGKGFSLRINAAGTVQFDGTMETGNVSPAVTATGYGWNCVGNPYPSAIFINSNAGTNNFIDLNVANIDPSFKAVYVWDQNNTAYTIVGAEGDAYTAALGQAFMVKAKTGTTNMEFTTDLQTHSPTAVLKGGEIAIPEIKLVAQLSNKKTSTLIKFDESMAVGLDPGYDVGILKSGFDLYTVLVEDNGVDFGMQYLPSLLLDKTEIAVGLESNESGSISFLALTENLPLGYKVVLEDRLLGTFTELNEIETYTTDITKNAQGKGRFYLHISNSTTKIGDISATSDFNAYYANEKIIINGDIQGNARAIVFDLMGRKIKEVQLERIPMNSISTVGLKNGIYLLNIQYDGGLFTKKIPLNR